MDPDLKQVGAQISADVAKQLSDTRDELKHQAALNMEELRTELKKVADGYGATLESIERELAALNKTVDTKFGDRDLVLADHNRRIARLEKRR